MTDKAVAKLLRSNEPLVIIEASAGCGKTYQGATYARDVVSSIGSGRLLILTHTHAAYAVFAERTKGSNSRVEIETIDALLTGNNTAQTRTSYQLSKSHRPPIDKLVRGADQLMILASQNDLVAALRAFWGRAIPIWEGHTREALATLVSVLRAEKGNAEALAEGVISFVGSVAVGFSKSSHGDRLIEEVRNGAARSTTGKPANIQAVAQRLLADPSHSGEAAALDLIRVFIDDKAAGFDAVKIDLHTEFKDAIRIGQFVGAHEGFTEISRKRTYARPSPPKCVLSSIHKAKGLECSNVLLMACDKTQFTTTSYAKCKMYVALSRAKNSLALVIPDNNPSPCLNLYKRKRQGSSPQYYLPQCYCSGK